MFTSLFKKHALNHFISKDYVVIQKFYCSVLGDVQTLPKAIVQSNAARKNKAIYDERFIENLFINNIKLNIFEYPQIDSLKEIESLDKISSHIVNSVNNQISLTENRDGSKTSAALACVKNLELSGFQLPISKNGYGFLDLEYTFIQEKLRSLDSSLGKVVAENENFGTDLVNKLGNDIQKEKYLSKLAKGESLACFAYLESEPFASLDPLSVNMEAVKSDRGTFVVSGKKNWVYNAKDADVLVFLANVTSSTDEKVKQPTLFLVDKNSKGITVHEPIKTVGLKDVDICSITFDAVELPSSCIIGKLDEGEQVFRRLFSKRILSDSIQCLVIMKKLVNSLINHCIYNAVFQKNKCEQEFYKIKVGQLVSRLYAVESMVYLIAGRLDHFENADLFLESLVLKIVSSETLQHIIEETVPVLGTEFYSEENKHLREMVTDFSYFSSCEHSNDYLRNLISSASFRYVLEHKKKRSPITALRDLSLQQHCKEFLIVRNKTSFNARFEVFGYIHRMFWEQTALMEDAVFSLKKLVNYLLRRYGKNIFDRHLEMQLMADLAIHLYTMVAILARGNRAYCLGFPNIEADRMIAEGEVLRLKFECQKIEKLIRNKEFFKSFNGMDTKIGKAPTL